jgi:hypothetical protein
MKELIETESGAGIHKFQEEPLEATLTFTIAR